MAMVGAARDNNVKNSFLTRGFAPMKAHGLSKKKLEHVFKFEGYGTKDASYWFLGIEEGGGSIEQLQLRARVFGLVEDIRSIAKLGFGLNRYVPTWRVMSKLIMAMQGNPDWRDKAKAQEYQTTKLGRSNGDTFLTELMPLPCPNTKEWPYESICPTRVEYNAMVRPGRIRWLRSEIALFKPRVVICYGKGNWRHHKEIFSDVKFEDGLDGRIQVGRSEDSTILLIPFLSPDLVTTALITQIAKVFGEARNAPVAG